MRLPTKHPVVALTAEELETALAQGSPLGLTEADRKGPFRPAGHGKPTVKPCAYFRDFDYVPSSYTRSEALARQARKESDAKAVSFQPFVYTGQLHKHKYEAMIAGDDYRYPSLNVNDPYEGHKTADRRWKVATDSKILYGTFRPPGKQHSLQGLTRKHLQEIVVAVHRKLKEDWGRSNFSVLASQDDHIMVRFEESTIDSIDGLMAYMTTFSEFSEARQGCRLSRMAECWGQVPGDGFAYFCLRTPWGRPQGISRSLLASNNWSCRSSSGASTYT